MIKLNSRDFDVAQTLGRVEVRLPIEGRKTTIVMTPAEANLVANKIGNAVADSLPPKQATQLPLVREIKMKPFGNDAGDAFAILRLDLDAGPLMVRIDHRWLTALAEVSAAALEHANSAGSA